MMLSCMIRCSILVLKECLVGDDDYYMDYCTIFIIKHFLKIYCKVLLLLILLGDAQMIEYFIRYTLGTGLTCISLLHLTLRANGI